MLRFPEEPVLTLHVKPVEDGVIIRLLNASDSVQEAIVGSGLLTIRQAVLCDALENPLEDIRVEQHKLRLSLESRRLMVLKVVV